MPKRAPRGIPECGVVYIPSYLYYSYKKTPKLCFTIDIGHIEMFDLCDENCEINFFYSRDKGQIWIKGMVGGATVSTACVAPKADPWPHENDAWNEPRETLVLPSTNRAEKNQIETMIKACSENTASSVDEDFSASINSMVVSVDAANQIGSYDQNKLSGMTNTDFANNTDSESYLFDYRSDG